MDWLKKTGVVAGVVLATFASFALTACGDDDSSSSAEGDASGVASVATFDDLAHCTKSHYGEIVFVEDEDAYFECTSKDWVEVDSATVDSILATSSSSEGASESAKSSSSAKADTSATAKIETKKVDSVAVSGFAQKGPFASGTVVTVYGLDSLLEKTKTKFAGKVTGDSGAYSVSKIVLPSQYALVEVNGFYANENTGKKTSGAKTTLNAIVDLSAGKSVKANVNIFTELEYARVKHLVLKENLNVPAAKKRATKELLAIFGSKDGGDLAATDLTLADTGSVGAALIAASVLLQGDLSVSKFGLRLGKVDDLFAATGSLENDTLLAEFADWASDMDGADKLDSLRSNIKAMNLSSNVPEFEGFLYNLWTKEYGLGPCNDSTERAFKKMDCALCSKRDLGFVCKSGRWRSASEVDMALGFSCNSSRKDSVYQVNLDDGYVVCKDLEWKPANRLAFEKQLLGECSSKNDGDLKASDSLGNFICKSGEWDFATEMDRDGIYCDKSRDYTFYRTESAVYYCNKSVWEKTDEQFYYIEELGVCNNKNEYSIESLDDGDKFVCEDGLWRKADEIESELGMCQALPKMGAVYKLTLRGSTLYYTCNNQMEWEQTDELAYNIYKLGTCSSSNNLTMKESASMGNYVCENGTWRKATDIENQFGVCTSARTSDTAVVSTELYVCENEHWRQATAVEKLIGVCSSAKEGKYVAYSRAGSGGLSWSYYQCNNLRWKGVSRGAYLYNTPESCNADAKRDTLTFENEKYYCYSNEKDSTVYSWQKMVLKDNRDFQEYPVVRIGNQIWMAKNLNYRYYQKTYKGSAKDTSSYCYKDSLSYCTEYGRLYIWSAAVDSAGKLSSSLHRDICPEGWHLPSKDEWETLLDSAGGLSVAGKRLKSKTGWTSYDPGDGVSVSGSGVDTYGFSVIASGLLDGSGFFGAYRYATFWSATSVSMYSDEAYWVNVLITHEVSVELTYKQFAFSVRCVRD